MFILTSLEVNKLELYQLKLLTLLLVITIQEVSIASQKMDWAMGLNISNIGAKFETVDKDFIPTNLKIRFFFS